MSDYRVDSRLSPFAQGLLNNLLNPKAALFFTALLPQFLPRQGSTLVATVLMAVIAAAGSLAGLSVYGLLAHHARTALANRRTSRALDRVTGVTLVVTRQTPLSTPT